MLNLKFIIIGAQKAGTNWMHETLSRHPQIHILNGETPFFEDPDFGAGSYTSLLDRLARIDADKLVGIHRTTYLGRPECAPRIARLLPGVKLVALLRNPVDRAISAYYHLVRIGLLRWNDPNRAFEDLLLNRFEPAYGQQILSFGLYGESLAHYLDHFPRDQILIITDSDMRSPAASYGAACRFLGVSDAFLPPNLFQRINGGVYRLPTLLLMNKLAPLQYHHDFQHGRLHDRTSLISNFVRIASDRLSAVERRLPARLQLAGTMSIRDDIRARLTDYYLPDIDLLARRTGLHLNHWKMRAAQ